MSEDVFDGVLTPTAADCTARNSVTVLVNGEPVTGFACWYPQMGGYVGKALVLPNMNGGCFDVLVWHDGEFPFSDDPTDARGAVPRRLHHCSPQQFIEFGTNVRAMLAAVGDSEEDADDEHRPFGCVHGREWCEDCGWRGGPPRA